MSIEKLAENISSGDPTLRFIKAVRKALTSGFVTCDYVIECGLVPKCVEFLDSDNSDIQHESTWILANVAAGTAKETDVVVQAGAIPKLIQLLKSPHTNIADHAVSVLGNIAGDGSTTRDLVLQAGALPELIHLVKEDTQIDLLRNVVWAISNLFRYKNPPVPFNIVNQTVSTLAEQLIHSEDSEVLADTCRALSYLAHGVNIQAVIDSGVVPRTVDLLASHQLNVLVPALRLVGNIVLGNDSQSDAVVDAGCIAHLVKLLMDPHKTIVRESAWIISNIAIGNKEQIQAIIDAGAIPILAEIMENGNSKIRMEAAWAVRNISFCGSFSQLVNLLQRNLLKSLCDLFLHDEVEVMVLALDTLNKILFTAQKLGKMKIVVSIIDEYGGLDHVKSLLKNENLDFSLSHRALNLVDNIMQNIPMWSL